MNIQAYPLQWPLTTPRTPAEERTRSAFKRTNWDTVITDLKHELDLLGADSLVISTNQPIRKDGMPYAQQRNITDFGIAVYFTLDGATVCLPCDRFATMAENLRAIVLHVSALRAMERYGVGTTKQAFAGYKALPAVASEEPWWEVLGVQRETSLEQVQSNYRLLARRAHPDFGGSEAAMSRLNSARDRALTEKSSR